MRERKSDAVSSSPSLYLQFNARVPLQCKDSNAMRRFDCRAKIANPMEGFGYNAKLRERGDRE